MTNGLMEQEIPEVYDGTVETGRVWSWKQETGTKARSHNIKCGCDWYTVGRGGANIKKITSKFHPAKYD